MKRRKKAAEDMAKGYLLGMACAVKILARYGWGTKKRLPEFADQMIDMFDQWQNGRIGHKELIKDMKEKTGIEVDYD